MVLDESTSVWEILLLWFALVVPMVLVVLLLPPELRKRLLQQVIRFALFMLALVLALRYRLIHLPEFESAELPQGQSGFQTLGGPEEPLAFVAPALPAWITYLISLFLMGLLSFSAFAIYRIWARRRVLRSSSLKLIAAAARTSLNDLAEGRQWGNVVVEAYARMTDAVASARGVRRDVAWTPREFAARLAPKGLPASAVNELTRLFEAARYGGSLADAIATRRARSCLESILAACGSTA
jgi:hypothetical protein